MESHLLQMRGLKQSGIGVNIIDFRSHLLQMRGLKPLRRLRPCTSAQSRIFYRCVD